MKVYAPPAEFPAPDFSAHINKDGFDSKGYDAAIEKHTADLREWLKTEGFTGKDSGKIAAFPVADGRAQYMLAEGPGQRSFLIHLAYYDAWNYQFIERLTKKDILQSIRRDEAWAKMVAESKKGD